MRSGVNTVGVKVPFQFDLSDANAVKQEINKIVADITNNQGQLIKYKINVDENQTADVLSDDVDEEKRKDDDDWWLSDDAFRANDTEENPFENDKKLS